MTETKEEKKLQKWEIEHSAGYTDKKEINDNANVR